MSGGGKGGNVVTGYKYYMDIHMAFCHGPVDSINKILIGERDAWAGNVTASTTISVNAPELFGGDGREGGVSGKIDVMMGEANQPINGFISTALAKFNPIPRYTYTYTLDAYSPGLPTPVQYQVQLVVHDSHTGSSTTTPLYLGTDLNAANAVFPRNSTTTTSYVSSIDYTSTTMMKGSLMPAYRGLLSMFFRDFLWSSNNPYFKAPWLDLTRILKGWRNDTVWYSAKAVITAADGVKDMNPVHIIVQALTDITWGMGYNISDIDDVNFKAAADVIYNEGFGLSMTWGQSEKIEDFIKNICTHINASLRLDLRTGLFQLKLIRDDYDIEDLVELNIDNILEMQSFQRAAIGDTANQIILTYTGRDEMPKSITVENLACIDSQGGTVSVNRDYPGIRDNGIAARVAQRDLISASTPLAKVTFVCNRVLWDKAEGDVFLLNWEPEGIVNVPFRIASINKGEISSGKITVEAVEDVFGLPDSSYVAVQPGGWVDPTQEAHAVAVARAFEAPYYEVVQMVSTADIEASPDDYAYGQIFATYGAGTSTNFEIQSSPNATLSNYTKTGTGHYQPYATLAAPLAVELSTAVVKIDGGVDLDLVDAGDYCYIDNECLEVTSIDEVAGTFNCAKRAVLDTVPATHAVGAAVWFVQGNNYDFDQRVQGELVYYRPLPKTGYGTLPIASSSELQWTMIARPYRPFPPGNVKLNGEAYPIEISGELTVTWSHRDRLQQTVSLTAQSAGNIGPEPGTTYSLQIYGETGTLLKNLTGLTSTTYTFSDELAVSGLWVEGVEELRVSEDAEGPLVGWTCSYSSTTVQRTWLHEVFNDSGECVRSRLRYTSTGPGSDIYWWQAFDSSENALFQTASNTRIVRVLRSGDDFYIAGTLCRFGGGTIYGLGVIRVQPFISGATVLASQTAFSSNDVLLGRFGVNPTDMAICAGYLWVACSPEGVWKKLNLSTLATEDSVSASLPPYFGGIDTDGTYIYMFTGTHLVKWDPVANANVYSVDHSGLDGAGANNAQVLKKGSYLYMCTGREPDTADLYLYRFNESDGTRDTSFEYTATPRTDAGSHRGSEMLLRGNTVWLLGHEFFPSAPNITYDGSSTKLIDSTSGLEAGPSIERVTSDHAVGTACFEFNDPAAIGGTCWLEVDNGFDYATQTVIIDSYVKAVTGSDLPQLLALDDRTGSSQAGFGIKMDVAADKIYLIKFIDGAVSNLFNITHVITAGVWYRVRMRIYNNSKASLYLYDASDTLLASSVDQVITALPTSSRLNSGSLNLVGNGRYDEINVLSQQNYLRYNNGLEVKLWSVRDGVVSWQKHSFKTLRGKVRVLEDSSTGVEKIRITEAGEIRLTE